MKIKHIALAVGTVATAALSLSSYSATFVDVTAEAGLSGNALGAGWGDYDNDGCVDLFTTGIDDSKLMKNNCDGTFSDVTALSGITMTAGSWASLWADYDNDGDLDLYIGGGGQNDSKLFQNNGDETFTDVTAAVGLGADVNGVSGIQGVAGAAWSDYDNDGDLDLFTAGRFGEGDLADGLWNNDGGFFTNVAAEAGVAGSSDRLTFMGAFFDYDMDGDDDLYIAVDFGPDQLYANNGDGTFTDVSLEAGIEPPGHGMGIAIGDLNNDGCLDIFSSNNGRSNENDDELADHGPSMHYINNCDGTFTIGTYAVGAKDRGFVEWGLNFVDYDNDGDLDFTVVAGGMLNPEGEPNAFYENDGSGQLVEITNMTGITDVAASFGTIWADYDNDGDLDWFVANETAGESKLYRNDSAVGHYLKVDLDCTDDNLDCVGAEVKVTAGSRTQMRVVQAGVSYAGSEPLQPHFGLGVKDMASSVMVTWPNGTMTEVTDVAADQTVVITQEATDPEPEVDADVFGILADADGNPIANAVIYVRQAGTAQAFLRLFSDVDGTFAALDLPAGDWEILAILPRQYISASIPLTLEDGDVVNLEILMNPIP